MFLTIFVPVGLFIGGIIAAIHEREWAYFWFVSVLAALVGTLATFLITAIIGTSISSNEIIYEENVTPIVALQDNKATQGTFFLGTGGAKDGMYYYYMIATEQGYKMQELKASSIYIKYDTEPRVVTEFGRGFKHWYNYIWAFPIHTHRTIYVPEGTILQDFNIDLQ